MLNESTGQRHWLDSKTQTFKFIKATAREAEVDAVLANLAAALCASWHLRVIGTQVAGKVFVAFAACAA